jgi:hypothetical protein
MSEKPENLNQLARRLRLPAAWIKAEVAADRLPCLRVGRCLLFSPEAVDRALLQRAALGPGDPLVVIAHLLDRIEGGARS